MSLYSIRTIKLASARRLVLFISSLLIIIIIIIIIIIVIRRLITRAMSEYITESEARGQSPGGMLGHV